MSPFMRCLAVTVLSVVGLSLVVGGRLMFVQPSGEPASDMREPSDVAAEWRSRDSDAVRRSETLLPIVLTTAQPVASKERVSLELAKLDEIAGRLAFPLDCDAAPAYAGEADDHAYLARYVRDFASRLYSVEPALFDEPTIVSTGLLRDLLHKFNFSVAPGDSLAAIIARQQNIAPIRQDIAETWRYPSRGVCGQLSFALFQLYRAFGYRTNRISAINGQVGPFRQGRNYSNSHVTTEVFIPEVAGFVIQDPTFNAILLDSRTDLPLGWLEAHQVVTAAGREADAAAQSIKLVATWVATGFPHRQETNTAEIPSSIRAEFATDCLDIAAQVQAWDPVTGLRDDFDLFAMFRSLRDAHGPTGRGEETAFELIDIATGEPRSSWDTTRQLDGTYVSVERTTGKRLRGSYDQLVSDALNGDLDLNPGVDLTEFKGVAHLVTLEGKRVENPLITSRHDSRAAGALESRER